MSGNDLQVVNGGSISSYAPRANTGLMPVYDIQSAIERRNAIVEFTKAVMVEGQDYGKIPGTDKDTLLKPGAEKLASLFGLRSTPVIVSMEEDWTGERHGGEPFFNYLYRCQLWRADMLVAEADGSCNSWEAKYRYRNAERVCPQCGKSAIIVGKPEYGGGFVCFKKKGGCGTSFLDADPAIINQQIGRVPNPDIFSIVNTLQKMAQKRALVAVTLLAVNASEFFTQDVEDMSYIDTPYRAGPLSTVDEAIPNTNPDENPAPAPTQYNDAWKKNRSRVVDLITKLSEDRKAYWLAEIERRFERTFAKATNKNLNDLVIEIEQTERSHAAASSMSADDVADANFRDVPSQSSDDAPHSTFRQSADARAVPAADPAPVAYDTGKRDTSEKQQLRVKIDQLKRELWTLPETRDGHYQEFLQAHFNLADTTRADKDTLHQIANALQCRVNARQAAMDADDEGDPFADTPATGDLQLNIGGEA